jgi:hypothetical protein
MPETGSPTAPYFLTFQQADVKVYTVLITTEKQKDNLAKFFYDIAKIDFAALVVAHIANPSGLKIWIFVTGILATIIPLIVALNLDRKDIE